MSKTETIKFNCDRCGKDMHKPDKVITFTKDISDLWKPTAWGKVSKSHYDICANCLTSFIVWIDSPNRQ